MQERKSYILEKSLECFMINGLVKTTMSVLVEHIGGPRALIYYYYPSKDALVIACAEEAAKRLEEKLMKIAIDNITDPELMFKLLKKNADDMAPMMRFLVSVAVSAYYGKMIKPAIKDFAGRYNSYAEQVSEKLNCDVEKIRPTVYMAILSMTNYMIFGEEELFAPQMQAIVNVIKSIL